MSVVYILVFIAASSAFGFVINDISDIPLDARAENPRNPLADGSLSVRIAYVVSAIFLVISLACMAVLPHHLILIECCTLFVFLTYSYIIEAKNIAGLDLVYHALFPALYGLIGYALYYPLDLTGIIYVFLLGTFGVVGELGNEIRDLEKDRTERKNTVVIMGERAAFSLTLACMACAFCIITVFAVLQPGFFWLLPFVPFGFLLIRPVLRALHEPHYRMQFVDAINTRAMILATGMLVVYGVVRFTEIL
jgi:4-hydroxybenzoate polyprenyltransferase